MLPELNILIAGAGSLGSLLGAYLSEEHKVTLYGRGDHIDAIKKQGLKITGVNGDKRFLDIDATSNLDDLIDLNPDIAFIGVKSYDTDKILQSLENVNFNLIASLQNGLKDDILTLLKRIVPKGGGYKHDRIDNNAHSHLMSIMLGPGVTVPIEDGKLVLGPWQSIFFVECDGPRNRELFVNIIEG